MCSSRSRAELDLFLSFFSNLIREPPEKVLTFDFGTWKFDNHTRSIDSDQLRSIDLYIAVIVLE